MPRTLLIALAFAIVAVGVTPAAAADCFGNGDVRACSLPSDSGTSESCPSVDGWSSEGRTSKIIVWTSAAYATVRTDERCYTQDGEGEGTYTAVAEFHLGDASVKAQYRELTDYAPGEEPEMRCFVVATTINPVATRTVTQDAPGELCGLLPHVVVPLP